MTPPGEEWLYPGGAVVVFNGGQVEASPSAIPVWRFDAEPASGYGEISDRTELPRTQYVRGYYWKDGTYVRTSYRSRR